MKDVSYEDAQDPLAFVTGLHRLADFYTDCPQTKLPFLLTPSICIQAGTITEGWRIARAMKYEDKDVVSVGRDKHYRWQARFGNILVGITFIDKNVTPADFPDPDGNHASPAATAALS